MSICLQHLEHHQGSNQRDRAMSDLFVNILQDSAFALQGFLALGLHMRSEGSGTRGSHTSKFSQRTSNVTIPANYVVSKPNHLAAHIHKKSLLSLLLSVPV